jgi:hypothetical protein
MNNTENVEPSVEYSVGKDSSVYTGTIKIHTPNISKEGRANVDKTLNNFLDTNIYPFLRRRLEEFESSTNTTNP